MGRFSLQQFADRLAGLDTAVIVLWIGLFILSVTLFVLSRTRWGQERPLRKCLVLSILAHVLLMGYATTVQIVSGIPVRDPSPVMNVALEDGSPWEAPTEEKGAQLESPWASHHHDAPAEVEPLEIQREDLAGESESTRHSQADELGTTAVSPMDRIAMLGPVQPDPDSPSAPDVRDTASSEQAAPAEAPTPRRRDSPQVELPEMPSDRTDDVAQLPTDTPAKRSSTSGLASSLIQQRVAMPQLTNVPVTVEPNPVIAGPEDAALAGDSQPAELEASAVSSATPSASRLEPSSLAAAAPPAAQSLTELTSAPLANLVKVSPTKSGSVSIGPPVIGQPKLKQTTQDVPPVYRLRVAPNRSEIAIQYGATNESEAAVRAALKWLVDNQERDGRWDPVRHQGGKEERVLGRDRFGAGAKADTGISALALLALLASGHTHEEGLYRENVQRGIDFLLRSQASDGNLGGQASTYAFMYCHAMATFALSEAYGMTGDRRLEGAVRRAVMYTVTAQNPTTGGWRYNVGDEGDTSQLGWQLMALKSADLAGIPMPAHTRQGAIRYLESVSSGRFGGLAAYRPVEAPSRPMTAEALACRHFLGLRPSSLTTDEAAEYLLAEPPGSSQANFYYWYYATLGLYQTQGDAWEKWNSAMQRELLARQRNSGDLAGSWDPNTVWGGYGGRVYTTALATLCLEVYYRFMPLYVEAAATGRTFR